MQVPTESVAVTRLRELITVPADTLTTQKSIVIKFNRTIQYLATDLTQTYPTDAVIARAKSRINLAVASLPTSIIAIAGPHMLKHQAKIFGTMNLSDKDVDDALDQIENDPTDPGNADIYHIIAQTQLKINSASDDQNELYRATVQYLLELFLEYAIHE